MTDHEQIANTLSRFMNCFDLKDWKLMEELLAPTVKVDYADLRGGPPSSISSREYAKLRSEALQELATHHVLANLDIEALDDAATVSASCLIFRSDGSKSFNSHAFYRFTLSEKDGAWRIAAITQRILWNEGDPSIHKGAK
ncbi:MAG: nuclear transport factor 2 family protein [Burkholderiales bacterium]